MSTFYNKFKEEERKEQEKLKEQELLRQRLLQQNFNNQPTIIHNKSTFKISIRFLISAFFVIIKGCFYVGITVLSSIGLTVLLNESLRNYFINFIKSVI